MTRHQITVYAGRRQRPTHPRYPNHVDRHLPSPTDEMPNGASAQPPAVAMFDRVEVHVVQAVLSCGIAGALTWWEGWNYLRLAEVRRPLTELDGWIRRHIRKCFWLRWHDKKGRLNALRRLGLRGRLLKTAYSSRGAWCLPAAAAVRPGDDLKEMTVGVLEVHPAAAVVAVDLIGAVLARVGPVLEPSPADAGEDSVEVVFAY